MEIPSNGFFSQLMDADVQMASVGTGTGPGISSRGKQHITGSPKVHRPGGDPLQIYADRFSGHYALAQAAEVTFVRQAHDTEDWRIAKPSAIISSRCVYGLSLEHGWHHERAQSRQL